MNRVSLNLENEHPNRMIGTTKNWICCTVRTNIRSMIEKVGFPIIPSSIASRVISGRKAHLKNRFFDYDFSSVAAFFNQKYFSLSLLKREKGLI